MKTRIISYIRHKARVFGLLRRLLVFSRRQSAYLATIHQSGLFDRAFYRRQNPQLMPLFLWLPERHYVAFGEPAGLFPRPDFSPAAYLRLNPDAVESGEPPFLHFIEQGRHQHRPTRDPSPTDPHQPAPLPQVPTCRPRVPLAAVVHIFYADLWPEIEQRLATSGLDLDLYVTITDLGPASRRLAQAIEARHPQACVVLMPNHGRDVFPWVHLINSGALSPYRAVCKLHTKRSPHLEDGDAWRQGLLDGILPGGASGERLQAFIDDGQAGLLVSSAQHLVGAQWWGANQARATELLARAKIRPDPHALNFAAGSMFWVKTPIIQAIARLNLSAADFECEQGGTDGSTAHAFERMLGYLVVACGLSIRVADV